MELQTKEILVDFGRLPKCPLRRSQLHADPADQRALRPHQLAASVYGQADHGRLPEYALGREVAEGPPLPETAPLATSPISSSEGVRSPILVTWLDAAFCKSGILVCLTRLTMSPTMNAEAEDIVVKSIMNCCSVTVLLWKMYSFILSLCQILIPNHYPIPLTLGIRQARRYTTSLQVHFGTRYLPPSCSYCSPHLLVVSVGPPSSLFLGPPLDDDMRFLHQIILLLFPPFLFPVRLLLRPALHQLVRLDLATAATQQLRRRCSGNELYIISLILHT